MILVDTSVWIDHLRRGHDALASLLHDAQVLCHPFIIGELACGNLTRRSEMLSLLAALPQATVANHHEVLAFVQRRRLMGCGIGWIDAHLLASAMLAGTPLWTLDKPLAAAARSLKMYAEL